jgi:hypothetical protein
MYHPVGCRRHNPLVMQTWVGRSATVTAGDAGCVEPLLGDGSAAPLQR